MGSLNDTRNMLDRSNFVSTLNNVLILLSHISIFYILNQPDLQLEDRDLQGGRLERFSSGYINFIYREAFYGNVISFRHEISWNWLLSISKKISFLLFSFDSNFVEIKIDRKIYFRKKKELCTCQCVKNSRYIYNKLENLVE